MPISKSTKKVVTVTPSADLRSVTITSTLSPNQSGSVTESIQLGKGGSYFGFTFDELVNGGTRAIDLNRTPV